MSPSDKNIPNSVTLTSPSVTFVDSGPIPGFPEVILVRFRQKVVILGSIPSESGHPGSIPGFPGFQELPRARSWTTLPYLGFPGPILTKVTKRPFCAKVTRVPLRAKVTILVILAILGFPGPIPGLPDTPRSHRRGRQPTTRMPVRLRTAAEWLTGKPGRTGGLPDRWRAR